MVGFYPHLMNRCAFHLRTACGRSSGTTSLCLGRVSITLTCSARSGIVVPWLNFLLIFVFKDQGQRLFGHG